jgi:hypothetical protein
MIRWDALGGWGKCPCCGKKAMLTEDHVKKDDGRKTGEKVMICRDCHIIIENYRIAIRELRAHEKA